MFLAGFLLATFLAIALLLPSANKAVQSNALTTAPAISAPMIETKPEEPTNTDRLVLELFNPSDQSLTHQLNKTNLSQQIEQALTISFILTKCGTLSQSQYRDTFRALILYAEQTHLANNAANAEIIVRRISESSGASYSLIYSRLSCTSPQLPALANQLRDWTNGIMSPAP
jgi:hypothetical protein